MTGCFAAAVVGQQPAAELLDLPALLQRLVDLDRLWQPPLAGERCVQFSSHDRRSVAGPGDPSAWYANDDRGHYLRVVSPIEDTPAARAGVPPLDPLCDRPFVVQRTDDGAWCLQTAIDASMVSEDTYAALKRCLPQ